MKIKKIYLKKITTLLKYNKYLITSKVDTNKPTNKINHRVTQPLFRGGLFKKILIAENDENLLKILISNKSHLVCLLYNNKWYLGNSIKQKNLLRQNKTILALLRKLQNKIA